MSNPGEGVRPGLFFPAHWIYAESSTKKHRLGTKLELDSRVFRYAKASEALTAGNLATAVLDSDVEDTVTVAHAIGTKKVTVTAGTEILAAQYEDGYLDVDEGTGVGDQYRIRKCPAIANGSTGIIELFDGLLTAWVVANTDIILYQNEYVVQESNSDQIECPMGVSLIDVTSGYYFWLQVAGSVSVLQDEAFGNATNQRLVTVGSSTDGAVEAYDAAAEPIVGMILHDAADTEDAKYIRIKLMLGG